MTVADILDSIAMRRGEQGTPDNATESKRRITFINQAQMSVLTKNTYYFTEKTLLNDKTIANQEVYTLPPDFDQMIEVRIDNIVRIPEPSHTAFESYLYPTPITFYTGYYMDKYYYIFGGEIHFLPLPTATSVTNNIQYRYYSWPAKLTATTDTIVIPEAYCELLSAYACARLAKVRGKRGSASDDWDEYQEIVKDMNKENLRRQVSSLG